MFDLRNHGETVGGERTFGINEPRDVSAVIDYLESIGKAEKVGALGCSMGAGTVLTSAAQDKRLDAVVADSPYWSVRDAGPTLVSYIVGKGIGAKPPEPLVSYLVFLYDAVHSVNYPRINPGASCFTEANLLIR